MHQIGMFDRKGPNTLDGFAGSGADFLEQYKPYILDGKTIITSPHKIYGPETNALTTSVGGFREIRYSCARLSVGPLVRMS